MFRRLAITLLIGVVPSALAAQSIRGTIVAKGDSAVVSGAVILLLNGADSIVARSLSNERGEYRVTAPAAGRYRLRTLRIGFRPVVSDPIDLAVGQDISRRLSFADMPFQMDTVRVVGANACGGRADSTMSPLAVFEQARTALTAAQVSAADRALASTVVRFDRVIDPVRDKQIKQASRLLTQFAPRPWVTLRPDSLRRVGYVVTDTRGDITYYAPDLDVLVSDDFIGDHCFRIVASRDTSLLGLAFEPTRERSSVAEIRGTLWLNRRTSELHDLEYRYVNISRALADGRAGGSMAFARLPTGAWMISRWDIRIPVQEAFVSGGFGGTTRVSELRLAEIRVTGGELVLVRRGRDTLFTGTPLMLVGIVSDSVTGRGLAGARVVLAGTRHEGRADGEGRFRLPNVLPGSYEVAVHTPALDSLGTAFQLPFTLLDETSTVAVQVPPTEQIALLLCGNKRVGLLTGTARLRGDSIAPGRMKVSVEWPDTVVGQVRSLESRADSVGRFRVCGLPLRTAVAIHVTGDSIAATVVNREIASGLVARAEIVVEPHVNHGALLVGQVLTDSTRQPIGGVEVVIPTLGLATRTNERGEFRISDVPPGKHQVIARRFGYGPLDAFVSFAANETVDRKIVLTRIAMLDTMNVTGQALRRGNGLGAFEERRRLGLGKFIDSTELGKNENRRLGDLLSTLSGVRMVSPPVCGANRLVYPFCVMDGNARVAFSSRASVCPMQVVVDGATVYRAKEGDRAWANMFDVTNFLPVSSLAAVEVYRTVAEVPPEYGGSGAVCGLLMLWTRRG